MKTGRQWRFPVLLGLSALLMLSLGAAAQPEGGPGGGDGGGRREGGPRGDWRGRRMDPEQMRKMMSDRLKEQLGVGDEEWTALEPLVQEVMTAQRELRSGGRRMMFGPPPREGENENSSTETEALRTLLDNPNAQAPDIKAKLDAYRAAVAKKETALKEAREKLRSALTIRQEAQLVLMGILD